MRARERERERQVNTYNYRFDSGMTRYVSRNRFIQDRGPFDR